MDYLDAHQVARLECLKLLAPQLRHMPPADVINAADVLARFVLEGVTPASEQVAA